MAREVTTQKIQIKPCGQVAGGSLSYTYHPSTGELHYQGHILLWRFFWRKRHLFSGVLNLDPRSTLSARAKRDHTVCFRDLIVRTDSVENSVALCTLDFAGAYPGQGIAAFDISGETVRLRWAYCEGVLRRRSIFGRDMIYLNVEADDGDRDPGH